MPFFKHDDPQRDRNLARLDTWIWVLVYGGLIALVLGLFVLRADADLLGHSLVWGGGIVAAMGAALVVVRSRQTPPPARKPPTR